MERTERWFQMDRLLKSRRCVTMAQFVESMEVSRATVKRDIQYLRDRLHAPIIFDREQRGYRYDLAEGERFELPGLWLNSTEIHGLLVMEHLLERVQPGFLEPYLQPLRERIRELLEKGNVGPDELADRVRVIHMAQRRLDLEHFAKVADATFTRRRLKITHLRRETGELLEREISPQRLCHYRDNWYVDAWCHLRGGLRSFSLDAIRDAATLDTRAKRVGGKTLDAELGSGYGIFAGSSTQTAKIRFSPKMALWVSAEEWHPEQSGILEPDGHYVLSLPYSQPTELLMDVMRYGADAEILQPAKLRRAVGERLAEAARQYDD